MLAAYFCHSRKSQVEYNYKILLIKVDWLAACIALKEVGAVLVVFLWRWRKIFTILQLMGSRVRPFRFKIFFAYKRNKANLDPFHMCFTISL
jgi:hypothetical protein